MNTRWKCSLTVVKSRIDLAHRKCLFLESQKLCRSRCEFIGFFDRGVRIQGRSECSAPITGSATWKASERKHLSPKYRRSPQKAKFADSRFPNPLRLHSRRDYQDPLTHYHNAYSASHQNHDRSGYSSGILPALYEHSSHYSILR